MSDFRPMRRDYTNISCICALSACIACAPAGEEVSETTETTESSESETGAALLEYELRLEFEGLKGEGLRLRLGEEELLVDRLGMPRPAFTTSFNAGQSYAVEILSQPRWPAQDCAIGNGDGTILDTSPTVTVSCTLELPAGLDLSFGSEGLVLLDDFTGISDSPDVPFNLALTSDDELIVAGQALSSNEFDGVVWHLDSDGTPSSGFGENGVQLFDNTVFETFVAASAAPDGSIYAAGRRFVPMAGADLLIVHFLADGTLDPQFGTGGWALYDNLLGGCPEQFVADNAMDLASTPEGLLVSGGSVEPDCEDTDAFIVRIDPITGLLDPTYGEGGVFRTQAPGASPDAPNDTGVALFPRADGRVWLAGINTVAGTTDRESALLWRVEPEGALDLDFAEQGALSLSPGGSTHAWAVAGVANGGAVVVGEQHADTTSVVIWRVSETGQLMPEFGEGGTRELTNAGRYLSSRRVALDSQGRILILGTRNNLADADIAVWRLLPSGELDPSFSDGGLFVWDGLARDVGYGLTLDSSDRVLVSASTLRSDSNAAMLILRVDSSP